MIDMNPNGYLGYFARGTVYYYLNKYSEAKSDYNTALKLDTYKDKVYVNLTNQLLRSTKQNE